MITTGISSHVRYLLEEKGVRLLSLSLLCTYYQRFVDKGYNSVYSISSVRQEGISL